MVEKEGMNGVMFITALKENTSVDQELNLSVNKYTLIIRSENKGIINFNILCMDICLR